jgi:UDP-3-O-[3-hydroxymyristoyl] N-acetylglucosamine deacetylase
LRQTTIVRDVEWGGVGLHTGTPVRVGLTPASADTGIVFARAATEHEAEVVIPARHAFLRASTRATTLGLEPGVRAGLAGRSAGDASQVATVEHLLATLYALGIDNVRVHVEGSELPAMDGSALPLVVQITGAGRAELAAERRTVRLRKRIEIRDGDRRIVATPSDRLEIVYSIDFDHPMIGRQTFELSDLDAKRFENELAGARTFGFVHEVEALRTAGLARGASLENTLVLDDRGLLNEGGLRYPDEFVRHKVIDLLGDLALIGAPLHARIEVERGGHALHHRLVAAILEDER